jgi:hypothetical protein
MTITLRRAAAAAFTATLLFAPAACSDEDGDGAETDEEVDQIDEGAEDTGEQLEEELDEGEEEVEE